MSAGIQINKAEIDNQAGSIARNLFAGLANVAKFKAWLDGLTSADLVNTYGYVQADADNLKSAFTEMGDLNAVWNGTGSAYLTGAHTYQTFPRRLLGTGLF
jgi:hypothetical protein